MKFAIVLAVALLAGCGHMKKQPEQVMVPIAVPCKTETPNAPTYRYNPPYADVYGAVRDLLGDREVAKAYQGELETALKSCK
jgi:hypothetical protein